MTVAVIVATTVAAATSPSAAAFLYVPPEGSTAKATPAAGAGIGSTETGVSALPLDAATVDDAGPIDSASGAEPAMAEGSAPWRVRAEETLRAALSRWGDEAHVEVLFLTDRRYRLHEARAFGGSFDEATQALLAALSHLPHPPVGELRPDGRTLAVLHQASPHRTSPQRTRAPGEGQ